MAKINKKVENKKNLFGENSKIPNNVKVKSNYNNWVWWGILGLVVIFLIFYWFFAGFGKFEYNGLAFNMEKYGNDLILYHYSYLFTHYGQTYKQNIYLRINPKENNVPVDGKILFDRGREIYWGINKTGIANCNDSSIATGNLAQFLSNPQLILNKGTTDLNESLELKQKYITCDIWANNTVIILQEGNKTEITEISNGCYHINVNNCEIEPAVEKFIVNALVDAKEHRELATK